MPSADESRRGLPEMSFRSFRSLNSFDCFDSFQAKTGLTRVFSVERLNSGAENQTINPNQRPSAVAIRALAASSVTFKYSPVEEIDLWPRCWRTFSIPAD